MSILSTKGLSQSLGLFCVFSFLIFTVACAPKGSITSSASSNNDNQSAGAAPTTPGSSTTPIPTTPNTAMQPLAWESKVKTANLWSAYIYSVISLEEPQMLNDDAALDADLFCPRYKQLSKNQRLNFWGQLFAGIAKYESGWSPTSYYVETTMGNDPITGRQVASEGLLQLSYQDGKNYGISACAFDWSKDKSYSNTDARKTILDPFKNLRCGIKIMASLLKRKQMISFETGVYWSTLRKGSTHVPEISALTKTLNFCVSAN